MRSHIAFATVRQSFEFERACCMENDLARRTDLHSTTIEALTPKQKHDSKPRLRKKTKL
jgi:hypothetical protein